MLRLRALCRAAGVGGRGSTPSPPTSSIGTKPGNANSADGKLVGSYETPSQQSSRVKSPSSSSSSSTSSSSTSSTAASSSSSNSSTTTNKNLSSPPVPSTSASSKSSSSSSADVPGCMVSFGVRDQKITFISHPGVMALSRLLEMGGMVKYRAALTQEQVDMLADFDDDLARKAQVAVDKGLKLNFIELEYLETPGYLDSLLEEKRVTAQARKEVLAREKGQYDQPDCLKDFTAAAIPIEARDWPAPIEGLHVFEGRVGNQLTELEREQLQREGLLPSNKPEHLEYQKDLKGKSKVTASRDPGGRPVIAMLRREALADADQKKSPTTTSPSPGGGR